MPTQIADVVVPAEFSAYIVQNSLSSLAFFESGVAVTNGVMRSQLEAGAQQFTVPVWNDLADIEANISSDDPTVNSTPNNVTAFPQVVRKSFVNQCFSEMSLASELSGSDALARIQSRVLAYWQRQWEKRLIATMLGILYSNVANNAGDMTVDISAAAGTITLSNGQTINANVFNSLAVIETAITIGDRIEDFRAIAMHSQIYAAALRANEIEFFKPSDNADIIKTYRGMQVILDDNLTTSVAGVYISVIFGPGAIGMAIAEPRTGFGTELFRYPSTGNGAGQTALFSRLDVAMHPLGYSWNDGVAPNAIAGLSPTIEDLAVPTHWTRVVPDRKAIPLAFLISKAS